MHLPTPGIETNVAYGTGMLLFGLLVRFVRNRNAEARSAHTFYPVPLNGKARTLPKYQPAKGSISPARQARRSEVVLSSGFMSAPRERTISKTPSSPGKPVKKLAAPLEAPAPQISNEEKMNISSYPFESLDSVTLAEVPAFGVPEAAAPVQDHLALPQAIEYGHFEIDEQAGEIAVAPADANAAAQMDSAASIAVVENSATQVATHEYEMPAQEPTVELIERAPEKSEGASLLSFFGLHQQPFDVTPDPAYLYLSSSHRDALASLKQGIEHFRGFMTLIAEPGMGKTTLLNKLMEELTDSARVVFLFQTQCDSRELLCFILNELEVDHTGMDTVAMHRALNQALLEEMLRGRRFVLIVDEAQNLQEPVLETIRLLSDFETTHSKLIQIVMAGQPQLAETMMKDSLVQLRQRVAVLSNLNALNAAETAEYVVCRLLASGWNGNQIFTPEALALVAESSGGVPRRINNLCFNALLAAFQRGLQVVDAEVMSQVAGKLSIESLVRRPRIEAAPVELHATLDAAGTAQLAKDLAAALAAEAKAEKRAEPLTIAKPKTETMITGTLTEKVRSQGWSKQHEYRLLITLERDPISGLSVSERYYCASLYMDEKQAAPLQVGKPVRIKIEQD
jgi:general secretion pathway protein A